MLNKLRQRAQDEKGFTLIELLVVVLIIGILAAIAIPSFLNQRTKAADAEAKSAARTAQTAMESYFTDSQTYVGADVTALQGIEPTLTDVADRLTIPSATVDSYGVTVASNRNAGVTYTITRAANGATTRSCQVPTGVNAGGCKANKW